MEKDTLVDPYLKELIASRANKINTNQEHIEEIDTKDKTKFANDAISISPITKLNASILLDLVQKSEPNLLLEYGSWLAPNILYFEVSIIHDWFSGEYDLVIFQVDNHKINTTKIYTFQISEKCLSGIAVFDKPIYSEEYHSYRVFISANDSLNLINLPISDKQYNLEFMHYLNSKPQHIRNVIRENLGQAVINLSSLHDCRNNSISLLRNLQRYIKFQPSNPIDLELPFQIFFDHIIPISYDGFFVTGWIHDPYKILEEIEAITDLGFCFSVNAQHVYRSERNDVREFLQNARYKQCDAEPGFFTYIQADEKTKEVAQRFVNFHGVRFRVKLKDNISINVRPDIKHYDVFTAREIVSQIVKPECIQDEALTQCISPAIAQLQSRCMQKIQVSHVGEIGCLPVNPVVSIIIPLYKRLDFLKVQIPLFANDSSLKNCEIIYVLDSPEQAKECSAFFREHCKLYNLPLKLVVMNRNSGYSSANNAGVSQAKGKYLILMNSDVFPKTKGWLTKMLDFYQSSPNLGITGPKLLYEDESIQHAGMFFEKTAFPFWLTYHYYKGFPNKYSPANIQQRVPAITGACLMISRSLYERVGGMSTEYVIGDFEDSDLCLRCLQEGYESWYMPEVELYHLERQSVPLNQTYANSLVWQINARLHQKKWGKLIEQVMESQIHS